MLSFESIVNGSHTKEWTTRMKRLFVLLTLLAILSLACSSCLPTPTAEIPPVETATRPQVLTEAATDSRAVLYLGIMVHLEGWNDDQDQARFAEHVRLMREYASLFETYGARLTWESKEVTDGALRWGDNVLLEMQQRGHGVGVHADIGGERNYNCSHFAADLRAEK
jgi:hypothetical protein